MTTVTLAEAKARLEELVSHLTPGESIVITQNDKPVAQLSPVPPAAAESKKPLLGSLKGLITIVEDDDEHLKDFKEYM